MSQVPVTRNQSEFDAQVKLGEKHGERLEVFIKSLQGETGTTLPNWPGRNLANPPVASVTDVHAHSHLHDAAQALGESHGCHSCLTQIANDKDQPWGADHTPPTGLSPGAREALGFPEEQYGGARSVKLYPQCNACQARQPEVIRRLNADPANLKECDEKLIGLLHHKRGAGSVNASGRGVSTIESLLVKDLGKRDGCHSCGTQFPASTWHADHDPPTICAFSHVITLQKIYAKVFEKSYTEPTHYHLRPQCPRCSASQGGRSSALARRARELAELIGIKVLRDY
jgi:hypothetical protein